MTHDSTRGDCRPPDRKCCSGCGVTKPIDQFRRRRKNSDRRETRCRACHARYMRWYSRSNREQALVGFAKQAKWRTNVKFLETICRAIIDRYGGLEQFARGYCEFFRKMANDPRSSKEAADGYLAMIKLLETISKEQRSSK